MLFSRKSLGVEICPSGVAFALLSGQAASPRLERVSYRSLPAGALRVSLREQNVLDPHPFVEILKDAYNTLLYRGTRLSVSLPDAVGRVVLLDVEGRFKSRSEGLDIIRWKLKKSMPFDPADAHLDYQQLGVRENGDLSLLVALVSRQIVGQYEELLSAAGFAPARIDFSIFSLCRAFERRLSLQEEGALISFYDGALGVMVFDEGGPVFIRTKDLRGVSAVDNRVFMEINSSLLACRERLADRPLSHVFSIAPPDAAQDFSVMVSEATGCETVILETSSIITSSDDAPSDQESLFPFTAAIGAALRSL